MKKLKKAAAALMLVLIAYLILFHTPWIFYYENSYEKWYPELPCTSKPASRTMLTL